MPQHPIKIQLIDHVVIRAMNLKQMIDFYCEVLGCQLERGLGKVGLAQLRAGNALIDLVDVMGPIGQQGGGLPDPDARNMDHFCIRLESWDVDAIIKHLKNHNVEVGDVVSRYGALGNGPSLYIKDPEGNTVEIKGIVQQ